MTHYAGLWEMRKQRGRTLNRWVRREKSEMQNFMWLGGKQEIKDVPLYKARCELRIERCSTSSGWVGREEEEKTCAS